MRRLKYKKRFLLYGVMLLVLIWLFLNQIKEESNQFDQKNNQFFLKKLNPGQKWHHSINSFATTYSHLIECVTPYAQPWSPPSLSKNQNNITQQQKQKLPLPINIAEYARPASNETHLLRLIRAVLVYFPIESTPNFEPELKWLYRSWIESQKYESEKWRTDLIIFLERDKNWFGDGSGSPLFFKNLNCTFKNLRRDKTDKPMCTLIEFVPLQKRNNIPVPEKSKVGYKKNFNFL